MITDWSGIRCYVKSVAASLRTSSEEMKGEQKGLGLDLRQHFLPGVIMGPFLQ